ncbi:MAG: DNA polymerase IV [Clostridiales bacterium]|nr:DNA polymerase IV [Clostridiales bacterium]
MQDRVIFHCDCDAFFASVEETFHPEYRAVPMAVAGDPALRHGIILAKNARAKTYGVLTAETIWNAKKKCPQLLLVPPRGGAYSEYCDRVNRIYEDYTDLVEPLGIDESYLDVTGSVHLFGGDAVALAHDIRRRVQAELGITISVGVSWNCVFAKLASDLRKPNDVCLLSRGNYQSIAWPLPAGAMLMVGRKAREKLHQLGMETIGDVARADPALLTRAFGKMGEGLHRYATGEDDRPVNPQSGEELPKSVGNGSTFSHDLTTRREVEAGIMGLCDTVSARLRRHNLQCKTVQLSIKNPALEVIQRQKKTARPTDLCSELYKTAMEIFFAHWALPAPVRALTVTAQNLAAPGTTTEQLSLFEVMADEEKRARAETLAHTIDAIRKKHGKRSITSAKLVAVEFEEGVEEEDAVLL